LTVKKEYSIEEQLSLTDVVDCVKEHLERAGYTVTTLDNNGIGVSINAVKDKENFLVEAVGKNGENSSILQEKKILCAIGELVRKMKERGIWTFYGIAIPKSFFKLFKDFEMGGIQLLDFHFFIVESLWSLYHLDSKATIELIQDLKAGKPERLIDLDIDFKNYDYQI
jgi:hypothetical protein